jgi:FTR1 family protein
LISSLLVSLREGLEAALIIGIVLVYLGRAGRPQLVRFVWAGVGLAVAMSLATAVALERWRVNEEAFEGFLLFLSAFFVVTVIVWMNRTARNLRKKIELRVDSYADRIGWGAGLGLGTFVFLMVLREGAEMALILRAVGVSSEGMSVWIGTMIGLAGAVAVGLLFFQGTLKIPLGRFFAVTSWILVIVAVQLALTGVHELSEAGWLPASQREMAIIGPIVRNDVFFFAAILGVAALLVLREWLALAPASAEATSGERRKQSRWLIAAGATFVTVMLILTADFLYARAAAAASSEVPALVAEGGLVRVPIAGKDDGNLHHFSTDVDGKLMNFMIIRMDDGHWVAALEACMICGPHGYRQEGSNAVCRNCAAAIPLSTMGQVGGCNPIAVPSHVKHDELVLHLADLDKALHEIPK